MPLLLMLPLANFQFSPSNIPNVLVGDVIQFNFSPGNFHNVTTNPMGSVPAGAAAINSGSPGSVTTFLFLHRYKIRQLPLLL